MIIGFGKNDKPKKHEQLDLSGCRRLWAAVVYQAVKDIDCSTKGAAADWMFSKSTRVGSMRWICDMLDLDYGKLTTMCLTRDGRSRILRRAEDGKRSPRAMLRYKADRGLANDYR